MKIPKIICFLLISIGFSCNQSNEPKQDSSKKDSLNQVENELLRKELELKERELDLLKSEENKEPEKAKLSDLYNEVKKGVFIIYAKGDVNTSQGTGFFINNSGVAISNFHVFENANEAIVILDNGEEHLISKIIEYSQENDYVIFQVENVYQNCTPLNLTTDLPEIGATAFAVGNPRGLTQTLSTGIISGYRKNNQVIQTTAELTHGSSGGPLFNENGEVIGITSFIIAEANLNFAISIGVLPIEKYVNQDAGTSYTSNESVEIPTKSIKNLITNYYTSIYNKNYTDLEKLYNNYLDRFFDEFDVPKSRAIEKAKKYWEVFKITSATYQIKWETLNISMYDTDSYYVTFNMDYFITQTGKSGTKKFNLDIIMVVSDKIKVRSIYENILSQ